MKMDISVCVEMCDGLVVDVFAFRSEAKADAFVEERGEIDEGQDNGVIHYITKLED